MIRGVSHNPILKSPAVATRDNISVLVANMPDTVLHSDFEVSLPELLIRHGIGEHKAGAAHKVSVCLVYDSSTVIEAMKKACILVTAVQTVGIEPHTVVDVADEELFRSVFRGRFMLLLLLLLLL